MRIVLVAQEYRPGVAHGGIGTQTEAKARGLAALGHEVTIVSHSPDSSRHDARDGGVRVIRMPGFDSSLPINSDAVRWLTYSAAVAAELTALGSARPPDIVDIPEFGGEGYIYLLNRAPWLHTPVTVHVHGPLGMLAHTIGWPDLDSEFYRVGTAMESASLRLADAAFSSSRCSAEWCARLYGIDTTEWPVLHTGVDTFQFSPRGTAEARPTIVFVGRIAESKGADVLVDAAILLAGEVPALRLVMIGGGNPQFIDLLRARAHNAGQPDLLDLPGFLPHSALPERLARAQVFAAPSRYEGGPGFVYLEAMACGLPVIACSGSGAAEVVTHGVTGILVAPDAPSDLVDALRLLLTDEPRRMEMGREARRYAETEADRRHCIAQIEAHYIAVVEQHRLRTARR
jgi:glycosyltransferase involved in cell wall biosynthesis